MNVALLIGIGLGGLATILDIIGIAIPNWWVFSTVNRGLFRTCMEILGTTACASLESENLTDWWRATQAMVLLSIFALGAGVGMAILFGFVMKGKLVFALIAALMTFCGAGLATIGVIIFGAKSKELHMVEYLHAGYGLVVVAAILGFPASVMMIFSRSRNS